MNIGLQYRFVNVDLTFSYLNILSHKIVMTSKSFHFAHTSTT